MGDVCLSGRTGGWFLVPHRGLGRTFPPCFCPCCPCDLGHGTQSPSLRGPPYPAGLLVPTSQCPWEDTV